MFIVRVNSGENGCLNNIRRKPTGSYTIAATSLLLILTYACKTNDSLQLWYLLLCGFCHSWLPLIEQTKSYDAVYKWFDSKGHYIIGYIIMPNDPHALIGFQNTGKSINTVIGLFLCKWQTKLLSC